LTLPSLDPDVVTIAKLCGFLLTSGYALMAVLSFIPATAKGIRASWPGMFSATLTWGTILALFLIGGLVLQAALVVTAARIAYEVTMVAIAKNGHWPDRRIPLMVSAAMVVMALLVITLPQFLPLHLIVSILAAMFIVTGLLHFLLYPYRHRAIGHIFDIALYPLIPLLIFVVTAQDALLGPLVLASYVLVETFDSYAYLGGKALGKTKAFPILSPNKTIEGLAIGALMLLFTLFGAWVYYQSGPIVPSVMAIDIFLIGGLTIIAALLSVIGDLAASRLKRKGGVKDYPVLLNQQGGLLDIIDAWITTAVGAMLIMVWFVLT